MTTEPTASPVPRPPGSESSQDTKNPGTSSISEPERQKDEVVPKLRLHLNDLSHPASLQFLSLVDGARVIPNALSSIRKHLYPGEISFAAPTKKVDFHLPPTRSVTLILRPMDGVAYTTGIDLDSSHKEIHFNLNYIRDCTDKPERRRHEMIGVITHELVHCYQYDGSGTAPGGLIEGIADFVRLRAGLGPPHWFGEDGKRQIGDKWDAGYQKTAFFLDWLEERNGVGTVGRINEALRTVKYDEDSFWQALFGESKSIEVLWNEYCAAEVSSKEPAVKMSQDDATEDIDKRDDTKKSGTVPSRKSHDSDDIVIIEKD